MLAQGYEADDPGMKSCGYGEIIDYLRELENSGSDMDIDAMQDALKKRIIAKTRQYAKRQGCHETAGKTRTASCRGFRRKSLQNRSLMARWRRGENV